MELLLGCIVVAGLVWLSLKVIEFIQGMLASRKPWRRFRFTKASQGDPGQDAQELEARVEALLKEKMAEVDAEVAASRTQLEARMTVLREQEQQLRRVVSTLEAQQEKLRSSAFAELDTEISERRSAALTDIESWAANEKERLRDRFEHEYEEETLKLRHEMEIRLKSELDKISVLFAEFSDEEKKLADVDIRRFIAKKLSQHEKE